MYPFIYGKANRCESPRSPQQYWGNDKVEPRRPSSSGAGNSAATPLSSPAAFRQANAAAAAAAAAAAQPSMASTRSASPSRRNTAAFTDSTNSVVSNSHAKPRVEKFGGRLRTAESLNAPSSPTTASQRRAPSRTATMGSTTEFGTTIKPVRSGTGGSRTQVQTQAQRSPLPDATPAADGSGTLGTSSPIGSALQPAERAPWRP